MPDHLRTTSVVPESRAARTRQQRRASDGRPGADEGGPGTSVRLQQNFTSWQRESLDAAEATGVFTYKSIEQGAATTLVAAVAPEFERTGGHYLDDCREAYTVSNDADLSSHSHGVKAWAVDPAAARELWTVSSRALDW